MSTDFRVLLAAPTRRDGEVTAELLGRAGVECVACRGMDELAKHLESGAGAIVMTDAALTDSGMGGVLALLHEQPPWSDIPTVLLTKEGADSPSAIPMFSTRTNTILLDRPASTRSLVSAVQSALRARRKQYQIREQLLAQERAEQALLAADQRKDEFLATLAHELRNPLAAIRTGVHVLLRSGDDAERGARMLAMIERQSGQLVKLIDDLLEVSRIATGKVVLLQERIDLRSVIEGVLEAGRTVLDSQHELRMVLPPLPVCVLGDPSRLAQVVGNLVNNAIKYTPDGGRITVEVFAEEAEAVIRVIDAGVGIPEAMLEQVFEMFAQVDSALDRSQGGLGIGLSLVRRLVELHGGTVKAESAGENRGSAFTVRLPGLPSPVPRASRNQPGPALPRRSLRILVLDDNHDVADSLSTLLEANGHEIRTVYEPVSGLEAADRFEPHVVFCDIGLPGMSGHEVASRLRANPKHASTLLVAVTGWGNEDDKRRCHQAGFDRHFTKPVSVEQVEALLAQL